MKKVKRPKERITEVQAIWNEVLCNSGTATLSRAVSKKTERQIHLAYENDHVEDGEDWRTLFRQIAKNPWWENSDRAWKPNLEWATRDATLVKTINEFYSGDNYAKNTGYTHGYQPRR